MESKKFDKLVQMNGRVPESLKDLFWDTVPEGTKNQHVMSAAARLWISLPEAARRKLIDAESGAKKGDESLFVKAVQEIFRDEVLKLSRKKS